MTDATFEGRLGSLIVAYAEGGVRPIDAAAIAASTIETGRPRSLPERLRDGAFGGIRVTPRLVLLVVLALLAIALTVTVIGRQSQHPPKLADRPAPSSPAVAPSPSPASHAPAAPPVPRIAYVQDGDIFVAGSDGSDPVKVLDDPGVPFTDVRWLSDGRHVVVEGAFVDTVLDLATGEHHRLEIPRNLEVAEDATWQPGGDQLATLQHDPADKSTTLVIVDALAGTAREIPADPHLTDVAWSADGLALGGLVGHDLVRIDPVTGTSTKLASTATSADAEDVVWTADLGRVAYVVTPDNPCEMVTKTCEAGPSEIYVADTGPGSPGASIKVAGPLRRSRLNGDNSVTVFGPPPTPGWSPDGTWLAYRTADGLAIVRPDGTGRRMLVTVPVEAFAWHAEGSGVTFTTASASGPTRELFDVDLEGGKPRSLGLVGVERFTATSGPVAAPQAITLSPTPSPSPTTPATASPTTAPTPSASTGSDEARPLSGRLLVQARGPKGCDGMITAIWLENAVQERIGECGSGLTADGRHQVSPTGILNLVINEGDRYPISGRHEASPTGRWLMTPPTLPYDDQVDRTAWEVATWDGRTWMTLPVPWWNPAYGPYGPYWSPDDSHVALRTNDALVMADLTTRQRWTLPSSIPSIWSWSHDGQRIAFVHDGDAWIADADGTAVRNVSGFDFGGAGAIALSPDGATSAVTQGQRLWLIGDDGTRLAIDTNELFGDKLFHVSWSPDGQRLALVADADIPDGGPSRGRTVMIDRDGRILASVEAGSAVWSPTSETLAAVKSWLTASKGVAHEHSTTYLIDRIGATHTLTDAQRPTWAPDGAMLAVLTADSGKSHVDVVRADGTGRRRASTTTFRVPDALVWVR